MGRFNQLVEDFSRHAVPDGKTVGGLHIALIVVGVMITLPAFLTSAEVGNSLGLTRGVLAFVAGGLILAAGACLVAIVAVKARLSTYMILQFCFGTKGGKVVNLLICMTLFGWFGISARLFAQAAQSLFIGLSGTDFGTTPFLIFGAVLMTATTVFGFKALDKLAIVAVPLLLLALIAVVFASRKGVGWEAGAGTGGSGLTMGNAISAVVGGTMVGVTLFPDLCRYARNAGQGVLAAILGFAIGYPLVMSAAVIPSLATGQSDYLLILTGLGLGASAFLILVVATWTTNISNLYSASLLLATMFRKTAKWELTVYAGIVGTAFGLLGIMDYFISYLIILGIAVPPIAGIYVTDYFAVRRRDYNLEALEKATRFGWTAFISWGVGFAVALATFNEVTQLTGIPACDSALVSSMCYFGLEFVRPK
ncbi:MAG: cytosine permease [Kiritimatiellia bacterium]|nr:cytosine permease [Pseudomonadales bacterium]MDP7024022.1 cytosine permease [Kiritimatiellia bacterium]